MIIREIPVINPNLFSFFIEFVGSDIIPGDRHFLEHMLLNSNSKYTKAQISNEMSSFGNDDYIDAATHPDCITFEGTFLKKDEKKVIRLLNSIFNNALFKKEEILTERNIILEELYGCANNAEDQSLITLSQMLQKDVTVLGSQKDIKKIKKKHLRILYKKLINVERAKIWVHNSSEISKLKLKSYETTPEEILISPNGVFRQENSKMQSSYVYLLFNEKSCKNSMFLEEYLEDLSAPLKRIVREKKNLCYEVTANSDFQGRLSPYFNIHGITSKDPDLLVSALKDNFKVDDPKIYDNLAKRWKLKIATAKTSIKERIELEVMCENLGCDFKEIIELPTWRELKKYAILVKDSLISTLIVEGTAKK